MRQLSRRAFRWASIGNALFWVALAIFVAWLTGGK